MFERFRPLQKVGERSNDLETFRVDDHRCRPGMFDRLLGEPAESDNHKRENYASYETNHTEFANEVPNIWTASMASRCVTKKSLQKHVTGQHR